MTVIESMESRPLTMHGSAGRDGVASITMLHPRRNAYFIDIREQNIEDMITMLLRLQRALVMESGVRVDADWAISVTEQVSAYVDQGEQML